MTECEIKFENNASGVYFSGQVLAGQVVLNLQKPKKLRAISLKICGTAQCRWSENHTTGTGKDQRHHTVYYSGREDYITSTTYLLRSDSVDNTVIFPGTHTYHFNCTLPHQLPTSFEGTKGHIRYTVLVSLERPWKFDQTYRVAFTVLKPMNLNYESPVLRMPSEGEIHKTFCCGPCQSPPMIIRVRIPQSGYVPGQVVSVLVEITNQSRTRVQEVKFDIRKIIQYHSQTPQTKTLEEKGSICGHRLTPGDDKELCQMKQDIIIPAIAPTITQSSVVNLNYEIKVEVVVSGAHVNPVVRLPIIIGTYPLVNHMPYNTAGVVPIQGAVEMPQYHSNVPQPIIQPIQISPRQVTEELPPPTYEEVIAAVDINDFEQDQHPLGSKPFSPRYPVFHHEQASAASGVHR